jgi:hypothetical protein
MTADIAIKSFRLASARFPRNLSLHRETIDRQAMLPDHCLEAQEQPPGVWSNSDWQRAAVSIIPFSPAQAYRITGAIQKTRNAEMTRLSPIYKH